jgi:hypothetical protein
MVHAFLLGILVTLTPSLLAVAWLVWRAQEAGPRHAVSGQQSKPTTAPVAFDACRGNLSHIAALPSDRSNLMVIVSGDDRRLKE